MNIQDIPIWAFILVGFIAQLIDGALGMAYGVSSTTILTSLGVPQKFASAACTRPKWSPPASPASRTGGWATSISTWPSSW